MQAAQNDRRGDDQIALWGAELARGDALGLLSPGGAARCRHAHPDDHIAVRVYYLQHFACLPEIVGNGGQFAPNGWQRRHHNIRLATNFAALAD
jgi:hypothetical protein